VTGIIATYVLQYYKTRLDLYYWALPLIIILIFSYGIASAVLAVYDMAIDTIFICFCEDAERHDGSPGKEYYMSDNLKHYVNEHTVKPDAAQNAHGHL